MVTWYPFCATHATHLQLHHRRLYLLPLLLSLRPFVCYSSHTPFERAGSGVASISSRELLVMGYIFNHPVALTRLSWSCVARAAPVVDCGLGLTFQRKQRAAHLVERTFELSASLPERCR